jgi:hypothetical protein
VAGEKRQLRISSRSLPKHLADRLTDRMERIKVDPSLLLPECSHAGGCPRAGIERRLRRVQRAADSRARLRRMSRRGTPIARAYAGALDLLFDDDIPLLAGFPSPFGAGEVKFAQRGNAKKEVQAGVQNYTDKGVRLLGWIPYARGVRGVYVYSTDSGLLCSGREPLPPAGFLDESAASIRPTLSRAGDDYGCPHLKGYPGALPRTEEETHLAARWRESPSTLRVCRACAGASNLSAALRKFVIGPKVEEQVEAWVELRPKCREGGKANCHFDRRVELTDDERSAYLKTQTTDAELLAGVLKRAVQEAAGEGGGYILAGGECRGNDVKALVDELGADAQMRRALAAALKGVKSDVVLETLTASKLLSQFWAERGQKILEAACGNREVAARVLKEAKSNEAPATLVQRAVKLAREAAVEDALPAFEGLSAEAGLADRIARAFRRAGAEGAVREVEAGRTLSPSAGAVAWAFLSALDKAGGREWQFTKVEMERGANARVDARAALECRGEEYAGALEKALAALGIHESLSPTTT